MRHMTLMQQLIMWQQEQARKEHLEPYMVLQFNTIKEIVRLQPKTSQDLLRIKGIGPAKARKYGEIILNFVRGNSISTDEKSGTEGVVGDLFLEAQMVNDLAVQSSIPVSRSVSYDQETGEVIDDQDAVVSVTDFVTMLDTMLRTNFRSVRIQGEVVGCKQNASGHVYFEIKDRFSVMRCMIFRDRYNLSGVQLSDGMEIVITGYPNYHKQYGFGFVGTMVELYGEGALKKAYDDLKKKFDDEGLFAPEKKRVLPQLPERIGLITSRTGAAIGDFTTNVGQYGYKIIFHQSRVEGAQAVDDLMEALATMAKKDLDVLVIVRGGGSLESLQAFNNENIVRMIAQFPVPVIAGVGHEQDETLTTLVADRGVSTPTAAARTVRESWDQCGEFVRSKEQMLTHFFERAVRQTQERIDVKERNITDALEHIVSSAHMLFHRFIISAQNVTQDIDRHKVFLSTSQKSMIQAYERRIADTHKTLSISHVVNVLRRGMSYHVERLRFFHKTISHYDPQRQLSLGYSIARDAYGKIIRSRNDVVVGENVDIQVSDGSIHTIVNER